MHIYFFCGSGNFITRLYVAQVYINKLNDSFALCAKNLHKRYWLTSARQSEFSAVLPYSVMSDIKNLINPPSPPSAQQDNPGSEAGADEDKVPQDAIIKGFDKIKTHFPAARIKKIMQSDEEIGKVAQATPVIVGRALEVFMANLVEASIKEAKRSGARRIGVSHVRSAVENTEQFDFLVGAVNKNPSSEN